MRSPKASGSDDYGWNSKGMWVEEPDYGWKIHIGLVVDTGQGTQGGKWRWSGTSDTDIHVESNIYIVHAYKHQKY